MAIESWGPKIFSYKLWQPKVNGQKISITQFNDRKIKIGDRIHFRSPHTLGATQMYWVYVFMH
jgi:hypothetical protein